VQAPLTSSLEVALQAGPLSVYAVFGMNHKEIKIMDNYQITTAEELTKLIGEPIDLVKEKVGVELDEDMVEFISKSSLVFISTIDSQGNPDISPKGDPAGFVMVKENSHLCIPDRPGNKLMFGFHNLLANPSIGLIFVVPNLRETLRIKGKAILSNDPELLDGMSVGGKPAVLATKVSVEECFFHCGKAMIRSKVWQPESWQERSKSPIVTQMAKKLDADQQLTDLIESEIESNYENELY